jgi:glycerol kinase
MGLRSSPAIMAYLLALDQGTTSSRAIVFDENGAIVSLAQKEFTQIFPQPGWVEHSPMEIWSSQVAVAAEAIAAAQATGGRVAAIGITNQRETTLVWDRATGEPIHNAIVWQDRRTAPLCDRLKADGLEETLRSKTGLVIDPYFSGTKLAWILENVPGARERAVRGELAFGTVDTWLIWNLTAGRVHATDPSNASRTMLFNIHTGAWDDEMLAVLGVPRSMLPEVRPSSGRFGEVTHPLGLDGVPIAGVAGDQQAALFGQACFEPGLAKNTYGTGCFLLQQTGRSPVASRNRLVTTVAWNAGQGLEYALEGSVFIGGAVVQWLRDGLGLIRESAEVEALARSVPDSGGVFLVPAFAGLGAPYWDPYARGAMVGLTRGATAAHVARAALESIAYQVADLLGAMRDDSSLEVRELRADGGASRNDLLLQFQADLLQVPVARAWQAETTALGAAFLAGLAVGLFPDRHALATQWRAARRFEPAMPASEAAERLARWRRAVQRACAWEQA